MSTAILPVIEPIVIATPIVITTPTEEVVPEEEEEEVLTPTDVVTEPDYASGPRDAPAEVVSVRLQTDELAPPDPGCCALGGAHAAGPAGSHPPPTLVAVHRVTRVRHGPLRARRHLLRATLMACRCCSSARRAVRRVTRARHGPLRARRHLLRAALMACRCCSSARRAV